MSNQDFSQFVVTETLDSEAQEVSALQEVKSLLNSNQIHTMEDIGNLMQSLRADIGTKRNYNINSIITISFGELGDYAQLEPEIFEADEPALFIQIDKWGAQPIIIPQSALHLIAAKMDPESCNAAIYRAYNDAFAHDALTDEDLNEEFYSIIRMSSEVEVRYQLEVVSGIFNSGKQFKMLVMDAPDISEIIVIPFDIFPYFACVIPNNEV